MTRKIKRNSTTNSNSDQVKEEPIIQTLEFNGIKVGESYWFEYRGNKNCFGKVACIHPPTPTSEAAVSIYDETIFDKYVCALLSSLRPEPIGNVKKKRKKDEKK